MVSKHVFRMANGQHRFRFPAEHRLGTTRTERSLAVYRFDELIAQALAEGLTIVTRDKRFDDYGVALLAA
jgi:hypothetical protein